MRNSGWEVGRLLTGLGKMRWLRHRSVPRVATRVGAAVVAASLVVGVPVLLAPGVASAAGILPPTNPPTNVGSDTPINSEFCGAPPSCQYVALHNINWARHLEGLPPMVLPNGFFTMPPAEQLLVGFNLERAARGLPTFPGLVPALDAAATSGAAAGTDPSPPTMTWANWGSIYSGVKTTLGSLQGWMYDDGLGSPNTACTPTTSYGCWGHRDNILGTYAKPGFYAEMGAASNQGGQAAIFGDHLTADGIIDPYSAVSFPSSVPPDVILTSPGKGSVAGGTQVTVYGNYFTGATQVLFGNVPAPSFTVNWDGSLNAVTPPGGAGAVPVTVVTPAGRSTFDGFGTFTYQAPVSLSTSVVGMASTPTGHGYWLVNSQGLVSPHGSAVTYGSMYGTTLNAPITHIVATPDGKGYWLVASDGGTFAFGDAGFYGSMGGKPLNAPVVDIAPTQDGKGYWLVAADGGIFAFGDAGFHGSMGGHALNAPVVGISPDYATGGYWEVATDGGIFAFTAPFYGSMGGQPLNRPINGMTSTPNDQGYWFVASDGGIFAYGDAGFYGSMGGTPINAPVVGMATDSATGGYWMVGSDGGVYSFHATFYGAH